LLFEQKDKRVIEMFRDSGDSKGFHALFTDDEGQKETGKAEVPTAVGQKSSGLLQGRRTGSKSKKPIPIGIGFK
jgi:hypothetical protein